MRTNLITMSALSCFLIAGCGGRFGRTPDRGFISPATVGTHNSLSEGTGMLYTLRGGHIDLAHVRGPADQTKKAYSRAYSCIVNGRKSFTVKPAWERITNKVQFEYPSNWDKTPKAQREKIAHEIALKVAPVVGYNSSLYHEMLTWKGAKFFLIEPEFKSSFSWEDIYSNAVGTWVATNALAKTRGANFNATFTRLLNEELERLEVVSKAKAQAITKSVEGKWYTSAAIIKRNMDSYLDDDISPCIVPGYTNAAPIAYPLPDLDGIEQYGIGVTYTINALFLEHGTIKRIAGVSGDLQPLRDFKPIMLDIQREAVQKHGLDVHK